MGDVQGVYPPDAMPIAELAVRKTAGNALELAGLLAVGWSPIWLLAAASDLTGGTRTYLTALVDELKTAGVVPADVSIGSVEELLAALEQTSGVLAETVDVPPLNVADMRATWRELQQHAEALPDAGSLHQLYTTLQEVGAREGRSTLEVSSLIAAGALRAGIRLGDTHIFTYYREALGDIAAEGLWRYLRRVSRPYLRGARRHFDPRASTLTDRVLDRRSPG